MSDVAPISVAGLSEAEIGTLLDAALDRLGDRCKWRSEVRMLLWQPGRLGQAASGRIDRVLELDGQLLGIEVKGPPERAATLGEYFCQARDYACGQIAPAITMRCPTMWTGQQLRAVFLAFDTTTLRGREFYAGHAIAAERLFGPASVGFVDGHALREGELVLRLCAGRFWSARWGYNGSLVGHRHRLGSGKL